MDCDNKEDLVTVQGRDTPVPVWSLSGRAGSPGPLASDRSALPVENQAGGGILATGGAGEDQEKEKEEGGKGVHGEGQKEIESQVFAKRGIPRTPPTQRQRANSLPDMNPSPWGNEESGYRKRREREEEGTSELAIDLTRKPGKKMRGEEVKGFKEPLTPAELGGLVAQMIREVKVLRNVVMDNKNTKVEIKSSSKALEYIARKLSTEEVQQSLRKMIAEPDSRGRKGEVIEEVTSRGIRTRDMGTQTELVKRETKEMATQTINRGQADTVTQEAICRVKTYEAYKEIRNQNWPEQSYKIAFLAEGSPIRVSGEVESLVLYEGQDPGGRNAGIIEAYESKYPELKEMEGKMTQIIINHKVIDMKGETKITERVITRVELESGEEEWFKTLCDVRDRAAEGGRKKLALYPPNYDVGGRDTRKMVECVLRNSGIKGIIFVKKGKERKEDKPRKEKERTDAIIVKQDGKSYCELLRTVKEVVKKGDGIGEGIKTIRKIEEGNLAIIVDNKDNENVLRLRDQIGKSKEWDVRVSRDRKEGKANLVIRDIDGITGKEEVTEAIQEHLEADQEVELKVGELRPCYGGNQAVTISISRKGVKRLLDRGKIRIGLSMCSVNEVVNVLRCFRCHKYGHSWAECNEETDYSSACRNCGESGHVARDCRKGDYCLTCQVPSHRAGTLRCPEFKKALSRSRLRAKKKKAW